MDNASTAPGTQKNVCGVWWPGLYSSSSNGWDPVDHNKQIAEPVEIKDGAIAMIWADANNDGVFTSQDYKDRRADVGSLLVVNSSEKAEFYVWIDVVGNSRGFDISFAGMGGVQYVNATPPGLKLNAMTNLIRGYANVTGATVSTGIDKGGLKLEVQSDFIYRPEYTSDWARMTVFEVKVDMAFNHDRSDNDGGDGINIRTNGSDNTEHHAPEVRMNDPGYTIDPVTSNPVSESWSSPHGLTDGKNVLYLVNDTVTSYNRFVVSPYIPGLTLSLEATAGIAIRGWEEKDVEFTRGLTATDPLKTVSTGTGTDVIAGVAGFVQFDAKSSTSATVDQETDEFVWNVNKIKYGSITGKTNGIGEAVTTDPVTIYTILENPTQPLTATANFGSHTIAMTNTGGTSVTSGDTTTITGGTTETTVTIDRNDPNTFVSTSSTTTTITTIYTDGELTITVDGGLSSTSGGITTITGATSITVSATYTSGGTVDLGSIIIAAGTTTIEKITVSSASPWNANDNPAGDDKSMPWVSALEFTIETAGTKGNATAEDALAQLTTFLHSGYGLQYDMGGGGGSKYGVNSTGGSFNVTNYINKTSTIVNCYDQAAAVTVFGRLLGIEVQYAFSKSFGYIKTTALVGYDPANALTNQYMTNSPFSLTPFVVDTTTTYGRIMNASDTRTSFGNHAYATYNGTVYDACGGPVTGDTLLAYLSSVIDFDANIQWNLFLDNNPHLKFPPYSYTPYFENANDCEDDIANYTIVTIL